MGEQVRQLAAQDPLDRFFRVLDDLEPVPCWLERHRHELGRERHGP